jgi:hypothetical protein
LGEIRPWNSKQRSEGQGSDPERQHEDGADHVSLSKGTAAEADCGRQEGGIAEAMA